MIETFTGSGLSHGSVLGLLAAGQYGPWTGIVTILQGLVFVAAGVGVGGGILVIGLAGGNRDRHELGIHMLEHSLGGFVLGTVAVQLYGFILRLVVGL